MKAYERMKDTENLSWCKPYVAKNGKIVFAICEGEIVGLSVDGKEKSINTETIRTVEDILLEPGCEELGCCNCPWRDSCEAMDD